jgi:hypothetical protein
MLGLVMFSLLICLGVCLWNLFNMKCEIDYLRHENNRLNEQNEKLVDDTEEAIRKCICCYNDGNVVYNLDDNVVIYKGVEIDE